MSGSKFYLVKTVEKYIKNRDDETKQELLTYLAENKDSIGQHQFVLKYPNSSFMLACRYGLTDIVEAMLACKNVQPNPHSKGESAPLIEACEGNHPEIVKLLLEHDKILPNVIDKEKNNSSALLIACLQNNIEMINLLLDHKDIDVNLRVGCENNSVIMYAIDENNLDCVKLILNHPKIDINQSNKFRKTALEIARENNFNAIVTTLEEYLEKNPQEVLADNPVIQLFDACAADNANKVKKILSQDSIDINIKNEEGYSLLQAACWGMASNTVKHLLTYQSIDITYKDPKNQQTALEIAQANEDENCMQLLEAHAENLQSKPDEIEMVLINNHHAFFPAPHENNSVLEPENLTAELLYSLATLTTVAGASFFAAGSFLTFGIGQPEIGLPVMAVGAAFLAFTALLLISAKIVECCYVPESSHDVPGYNL